MVVAEARPSSFKPEKLGAMRGLRRRVGRLPEGSPALTGLRLGYRAAYLVLTAYWRV